MVQKLEKSMNRIGNWHEVDPKYLSLSRKFTPGGKRTFNISPNLIVRNDKNMLTYMKLDISKEAQNN
jgi:hypothetical protein